MKDIETLINLQKVDQEIFSVKKDIEKKPREISLMEKEKYHKTG